MGKFNILLIGVKTRSFNSVENEQAISLSTNVSLSPHLSKKSYSFFSFFIYFSNSFIEPSLKSLRST